MSTHIGHNYKCPECGEGYIPFSEEQRPCPKCGTVAPEGDPSIRRAVEATRANLEDMFLCLSLGEIYT